MQHSQDIAMVTLAVGNDYKEAIKIGIDIKRLYCKRYGYDFIYGGETRDPSRPIPWSKIMILLETMKTSSCKWIFWTDADSLIMNFDYPLEEWIDENYNLILTKDMNGVNSGQFFIRNCSWSYEFLEAVYSHTELIHHPWWEQQAIAVELEQKKWMTLTKILPQRFFNSYASEVVGFHLDATYEPGDFIIHFASVHCLFYLRELFERYQKIIRI